MGYVVGSVWLAERGEGIAQRCQPCWSKGAAKAPRRSRWRSVGWPASTRAKGLA